MHCRLTLPTLLALSLFATGCQKEEVTAYRIPKETPPPHAHGQAQGAPAAPAAAPGTGAAGAGADMASTPVATASGANLQWTAPAHWAVKSGSAMRKGSYAIRHEAGEADLSITAFPGDTGGLLANLNRWRGQIGLAPLAPAELEANLDHSTPTGFTLKSWISPAPRTEPPRGSWAPS
jgi:hypothetical protein